MKKQTVWLLTMLSLVVVLSVYYVTTPDSNSNVVSTVEQSSSKEKAASTSKEEAAVESKGDEQFTALRLQMEDQRSEAKTDLQDIITSSSASAQEKSKAYDDLNAINKLEQDEQMLEVLVKGQGFDDALVRADGESVRVTVKADKLSQAEANKIIQLVRSEVGIQNVGVKFEPTK